MTNHATQPESTPDIHITIDPSKLTVGYDKSLADLILDRCAVQILDRFRDEEALSDLRKRIRSITDDAIRIHVEPMIAQALVSSIQPTDAFGTPKGDPKTLPEIIVDRAIEYLREKVSEGGSSYSKTVTRVELFIRKEIGRQVEKDLKDALEEGRKEVRVALKMKGAEILERTIAKLAEEGKLA